MPCCKVIKAESNFEFYLFYCTSTFIKALSDIENATYYIEKCTNY